MKKRMSKVLSIVLLLGMLLSLMPASAFAEDIRIIDDFDDVANAEDSWQKVELADITASDTVAITMTKGETTWILPTTGAGSQGQPLAVAAAVSGDTLTADSEAYGWKMTAVESGGYYIQTADGKYLYTTATNNGMRIGSTSAVWSLTDGYLTAVDSKNATRYLGVYNGQDWRAYTLTNDGNIATNIAGQTLSFWKLGGGETPPTPTPTPEPVYLEKMTELPGDGAKLVIFHPESKMVLNDKPVEGEEKLAGTAGTLGEDGKLLLTDEMSVLTFGQTEDVAAFKLNDKYLTSGAEGNSLSFADKGEYADWTIRKDGSNWNILSVKAVYNNNQQALEYFEGFTTFGIRDNDDAYRFDFYAEKPAAPTASPAAGEVDADTVVTFATATPGAVIRYSTDGTTWTEGNTYTISEAVTVQVKAVLGGIESEARSFAYTVKAPLEIVDIATALAGEANTEFKVKGVVTLVDGKNIFIQDETGGICLYFGTAPTDIALGDTLIGTGTRAAFKGLPELSGATYEKSEGLALNPKTTTIGALTDADLCTYLKITDLEVTAINNINYTLKDAEEQTITLYKPVLGDTVLEVGSKLDFTGALGIYDSKQLRNTLASEITVQEAPLPAVATPTANPAAGEVEAGTVVTFSCATEGAVISYSTDNGENWTEGDSYTVNEAVTILVKAAKDGEESAVATFAYTIKTPEPETSTIAEALAGEANTEFTVKGVVTLVDGKNIYIQDETGGICLYFGTAPSDIALGDTLIGTGARDTYNGLPELKNAAYEKSSGLTLTPKATTIDALTEADICTYVKITDLEVTGVSGTTISLKDAEEHTIQIYKAVLGETELKEGDKIDFTGAVGIFKTTLQLRNTLASEIKLQGEAKTGIVTDLADLTDGAKVVILNKANKIALSQVYGGYYNNGVEVTLTDGVLSGYGTTEIWTVGINEDGSYTFSTADGKKLSLGASYSSMPLDDVNPNWTLTAAEGHEDGFYIENTGREGYRVEWYASKNYWSVYNNNTDGDLFIQQFYLVGDETPPTPVGDDFGLVSTLSTGDEVILYNAGSGMGLGNSISSHKISGLALTPAEGVITTDKTAVVWTVTVNDDGTVTFTQGDYTLGGVVSGSYNNLVVTDATSTKWTLSGPDSVDFNYFLSLDDMESNFGKIYLEYYNGFTLYGSNSPDKGAFGITFYKKGAEPEVPVGNVGDLVTDLSQLTDGATVAIYSPGHKTAISTKPNGDWYLRANDATIEEGKVANFTADFVWKVKVNDDGTYSFIANDDETHSITVWPSGNYAELSLNVATYPDNTWTLSPAKTDNCFYISSPTVSGERGPAYIEAYVRNEFEVFSGYFTSPSSGSFKDSEFALQFYLVNPDDAVEAVDDGEWDGVLDPNKQYVAYNTAAEASIGLFKEANYAMDAIPTTIEGGKAKAGNGAYLFSIGSMGRYYSFEINGKYLATNEAEELFFIEKNEDGTLPETAKWFLQPKNDGYIIYNKEARYNGTPVCIEYYSSVFSGWTFSTKNDVNIYLFNFFEVVEGTEIHDGVVQDPSVIFDCENSRFIEQDYLCSFTLDDLADDIESISIRYEAGSKSGAVTEYEESADRKAVSFTLAAADIDSEEKPEKLTITVEVKNSYGIEYTGVKEVAIIDEPFFTELTPAPNSQTRDDKRPVISAKIGNVGENPTFTMTINEKTVEAVFADGVLSYTPAEDLADGRTTVKITVTRSDNITAEKSWSFTVGIADYQLYFGQLHSHTTYSDGSGSLETALEYIGSLPKSANVQFVAFTDHSNYFDTTSAANPADALNDKSLMTDASRALWEQYKGAVADFNAGQSDIVALAGYEMTWSGGPGHINTFDSDGLVSRNNSALNNKSSDAGMKLYYETINKGDSLNQFNHPGSTFGNFTDFSYWDEATDARMFLVEVGNGEGQIGAGGYYPSYEQYILALDKGWHVAPTNNQDNHKGRWGNANDARDVILTNDFTEQGIYDAIRALRVYATEDKNLQVYYTVNDMPMGTIFGDENTPEKLNVLVTVYDPDASDAISKVELVVDGGKTAHTWDDEAELKEGALSVELDPEYSYYFIRVTQKDGDLAVTAPVWAGKPVKLGVEKIEPASEPVYKDEEATLVTTLFNNEEAAATVKALVYTVNGSEVIGTDTETKTVPAGGTLTVEFKHAFTKAKLTEVTVRAIFELDGKEYEKTAVCKVDVIDKENENTVTPIADVRAASVETDTGYRFVIEGVVTSNASGYDKDTAFFDCIYVQDETGGICCFPVSGEYKIGDKVRIVGHTDFYQAEPELQVQTIEIIGEGSVEPTVITAAQLNDRSAEGKLVTVKGTVESFELANGLIQTIMVKDEAGDLARVFIDGYITTAAEVENCEVGAAIEATGLASYDDTFNAPDGPFPRIRIRDRADVICTTAPSFTLSETEITVPAQSYYQLTAEGADNLSWSSDKENVATVDQTGKVFANLYGTAVVSVTDGKTTLSCTVHVLFSDVVSPSYYFNPVYWAAENGITKGYESGKDIGKFGVGFDCQRRELMIFLWRYAGEPTVDKDGNPYGDAQQMFNDLKSYGPTTATNKAIAWAYKEGITKGYKDGGFHPKDPIVRKDVMILLYRLAGKPSVTGTLDFPDCQGSPYTPGTDTYNAILWGSQNAITKGYSDGTFGPMLNCLREQIVTFLYRYDGVIHPAGGAGTGSAEGTLPFGPIEKLGDVDPGDDPVAAPEADPEPGAVTKGTTVTFKSETEGAEIMSRLKGEAEFVFQDTYVITEAVTFEVKAVIKNESTGLIDRESEVKTFEYTVKAEKPATPTADPDGGEVEKGQIVTFSCETEGATIMFKANKEDWEEGSTYTVTEDVILQVKAVLDDVESEIATFSYTVADITVDLYITLDPNGGKISVTRLKVGEDGLVPELPTPQERDGYIFGGWFTEREGGEQIIQGVQIEESITLYAHWYELRVTVDQNAVVPEALKERYSNVTAMKNAMLNTVKKRLGTTTVKGSLLYEITVEYFDGSQWLPIDPDLFPSKGVKVSLAAPSSAATTDRFVALHLFGQDCNGHKAGDGEMPTVTRSGSTLSFTVHGCSPLLLVWTSSNGGGSTPRTGDDSHIGLWIGLMALSATAMGAVLIMQKKKKDRT